MAIITKKRKTYLALVFDSASRFAVWRKSRVKAKGKRGGGGKSNKFKGRFQFTDVDEDKIARLACRKQLARAETPAAKAPMAVWMRVVTDYGRVIMMDADQFDYGGARNVATATPHFT